MTFLQSYAGVTSVLNEFASSKERRYELMMNFVTDEEWQLDILDFLKDMEDNKRIANPKYMIALEKLCGFFLELYRFTTTEDIQREQNFRNYAYAVKDDSTGTAVTLRFLTNFVYLYYITHFGRLNRQRYTFLSMFLQTIYNLEAVGVDGRPVPSKSKEPSSAINARVASIDKIPSVFHDNRKMKEKTTIHVPEGLRLKEKPFFQINGINAEFLDQIVTRLLKSTSRQVIEFHKPMMIAHAKTLLRMLYR